MSLPETCPFCGASVHVMEDGKECRSGVWVTFDCHTSLQTVADPRRFQSSECEVRERLRLAARVAELEARCKRLEKAAREVYIDSIASDHLWTHAETRNMHALRDVLEAKP